MINLVLSSHKLNDAQVCPRLYYYAHELLKKPIKAVEYFDEGDLMHYILRLHYRARMNNEVIDKKLLFELARNYAAKHIELKPELVESTITDAEMYIDYYEAGRETWLIEGVEEPFAKILFQTDKVRVIVTGTTDLRVRTNNGKGPRVIVDHKYEVQFRKKLDRNNQALAYCWAFDCFDFVYNRIGKQKTYKPEQRLERPYISYGRHHIEEWKDAAIHTSMDIIKFHELGVWPARYSGCEPVPGRKCTFYDLDNTTPSNREYTLNTFFKDAPAYDEELMEGKKE